MNGGSIGDVPVPGIDPYSEVLEIAGEYLPLENRKCTQCGSPHRTIFDHIVASIDDKGILSGDLSFKKMIMTRCISCGHIAPIKFMMVREM